MQLVWSRIWTRVVVSISYDDIYYTTGTSKSVVYYELLKPTETISGDRYRLQLVRSSRAWKNKRLLYG